jgi:anti-anti-sigma factor
MEPFDIVEHGPRMFLVRGELDMATAEQLSSTLAPAVGEGGPITVDISRLTFIDSTGLHALADAAASLTDRGCIIIHGIDASPLVRKVFELTQIGKVRNIHVIPCDVIT